VLIESQKWFQINLGQLTVKNQGETPAIYVRPPRFWIYDSSPWKRCEVARWIWLLLDWLSREIGHPEFHYDKSIHERRMRNTSTRTLKAPSIAGVSLKLAGSMKNEGTKCTCALNEARITREERTELTFPSRLFLNALHADLKLPP
jgi:hypothetical protein